MNHVMRLSGPLSALRPRFGGRQGIERMASAGFDAVDYTFNEMVKSDCVWNHDGFEVYAKSLFRQCRDSGMVFNQAHAPFLFDWDTIWQTEQFEHTILPTVKRSILCASLLEIPTIVVHPIHHIRYRGNETLLWQWNTEYYEKLLPFAKEQGVRIALENMWQIDPLRQCGDSDVFSTPVRYRQFLDSFQDEWMVACIDVGHAGLAGEDPANLIRTVGSPYVQALHIHDNHHKIDDHTLPYLGKLDWDSITQALGEIGYQNDFTFEVTNYLTPFDDDMADVALKFQVQVGRHLIDKINACRHP